MTKILTDRICQPLSEVISINQAAALKNRNIFHNVFLLRNIIEYSNYKNLKTFILSLGTEKAFDRIDINFLFKTLEKLGFPNIFVNFIRTIYKDVKAVIQNNGYFTKEILLHSGVSQGDSLSQILYVITEDFLNNMIEKNRNIKGFKLPGLKGPVKLMQFSDDKTAIGNNFGDITHIIGEFEKATASKVNQSKTKALITGREQITNYYYNYENIQIEWLNKMCIRDRY